MKATDFGYVIKNNLCLFYRGPLSQWWGSYKGQEGGFTVHRDQLMSYTTDIFTRRYIAECPSYTFNCAEQWMMACKAIYFSDATTFKEILKTRCARTQKNLGRKVAHYNESAWELVREKIVRHGNELKFNQNPELQKFLVSFNRNTLFAEASPVDCIWGIGLGEDNPLALNIENWRGLNLLGEAIRYIRRCYDL